MTIEKTIQDLTAAIEKLTEVLANPKLMVQSGKITEFESEQNTVTKTKKEPKTIDAEAELVAELIETKKPAKTDKKAVKEEVVEEEITVDVLRERTTVFGETKGRDATIALLKKYGAAKGSEVAADKRKAYVDEINKLLAA